VFHIALDCWTTHHEPVEVPGHHHQSFLLLWLGLDNQIFNIFVVKHPQPLADPPDSWFWRRAEFGDVDSARETWQKNLDFPFRTPPQLESTNILSCSPQNSSSRVFIQVMQKYIFMCQGMHGKGFRLNSSR
jgi:hypothetical protein